MVDSWQDKSFGESGLGIWAVSFGLIGIAAIYVWAFFRGPPFNSSFIMFIGVGFPILLTIWAGFYLLQSINVLQEIAVIDDKGLAGKCFFGRMLDCDVADIKSLTYYSMTWKIRSLNYFDPKIPGINIVLKNGYLFRISSGIEDFPSLVEALKTLAAEAKHIECNL